MGLVYHRHSSASRDFLAINDNVSEWICVNSGVKSTSVAVKDERL